MTLPCSLCGEEIESTLTVCPECQGDPAADWTTCPLCNGERVRTIGHVQPGNRGPGPWDEEDVSCDCGDGRVEAPYAIGREQVFQARLRDGVEPDAQAGYLAGLTIGTGLDWDPAPKRGEHR